MYRFVVCGRGEFPSALLTTQECYPLSVNDYNFIAFDAIKLTSAAYKKVRYVTLESACEPNEKLWQAFGWKIIK